MILDNLFNPISKFHHYRIAQYSKKLKFDNLVDVGCHKGEFLSSFLINKKIKKFYCFEPQKEIFKSLINNFKKNKKITFYNFALGDKSIKKKIYISNLTSTSTLSEFNYKSKYLRFKNFLISADKNSKNSFFVSQKKIDRIFKNISLKKSFLKIDVEGYEYSVLKGSEKKIKEIPFVLVEHQFFNQYKNNFNQVKSFLIKNNFQVIKNFYFPTLHYKDVLFKKKGQ
jgi:FkbM family methyltransferase